MKKIIVFLLTALLMFSVAFADSDTFLFFRSRRFCSDEQRGSNGQSGEEFSGRK